MTPRAVDATTTTATDEELRRRVLEGDEAAAFERARRRAERIRERQGKDRPKRKVRPVKSGRRARFHREGTELSGRMVA